MAQFYLIHINDSNRATFEAFTHTYTDAHQCLLLTEPASDADVDAFISANAGIFMQPMHSVETPRGTRRLYTTDDTIKMDDIDPAADDRYIRQAHSLISADTEGNKLVIAMDPRHETAILFRSNDSKPWSIAKTASIPKIDYIKDLLTHPPIEGLVSQLGVQAQLGIHTYLKDGQPIKVLMRYFKFDPPDNVQVAPMYIIRPKTAAKDRWVERGFVPEDFFEDEFRPETLIGGTHPVFGELVDVKHPALKDINDYLEFVENEKHFIVYKTANTVRNANISGIFLQTDAADNPVITRDNATALDRILRWTVEKHRSTVTLSSDGDKHITPNTANWETHKQKRRLDFIEKIEPVDQGVKVEFRDKSYVVDKGSKLTLHGSTQDQYLEAMILHAKENWGGKFKIDIASDDVMLKLKDLAHAHGVTVISNHTIRPARPLVIRPRPSMHTTHARAA